MDSGVFADLVHEITQVGVRHAFLLCVVLVPHDARHQRRAQMDDEQFQHRNFPSIYATRNT